MARGVTQQTALHLDSVGGHLDLVMILVNGGMSVDAVCSIGKTALHLAAKKDFKAAASLPIDNRADSWIYDINGDRLAVIMIGGEQDSEMSFATIV
ncbi:hypothetical protein DFP73DRAFT_591457 [Morchella snyderi]|nr:hypothetical protein DFP73DRAFT_591457 [Morchella snyderi]